MTLFEKIDAVLESKHLKRAALARMAGFTESRISRWFAGEGTPSIYQARTIARVLDVPLEWLSDDEAGFPPPPMGLSEGQRMILHLTEELGEAEAIRRLAKTHEPPRSVPDGELSEKAREYVRNLRKGEGS